MSRFNNGELINDTINIIKNIGNYSDFLKTRDDIIYKLEIIKRNLENNNVDKGKSNNFEEYLIKANQYISQYKPKNGFSSGYSNLFNIPKPNNENIQNYYQDELNYKKYNIENNYIKDENPNLKQNNYLNQFKSINTNNTNPNNAMNYKYNILQDSNSQRNKKNIDIETPMPLQSPPKKIEYNPINLTEQTKNLFQSNNPNNNIINQNTLNEKNIQNNNIQNNNFNNNSNPLNFNNLNYQNSNTQNYNYNFNSQNSNTQNYNNLYSNNLNIQNNNNLNSNNFNNENNNQNRKIEPYEFNDELINQKQNYNPSPLLQQYLSKNKNNSEYQFKPIEKISNDPIQTMNKGNRITKIIMKINDGSTLSR